jgi:hypothetical protein
MEIKLPLDPHAMLGSTACQTVFRLHQQYVKIILGLLSRNDLPDIITVAGLTAADPIKDDIINMDHTYGFGELIQQLQLRGDRRFRLLIRTTSDKIDVPLAY